MPLALARLVARDWSRRSRHQPGHRIGTYPLARRAPRRHADDRRVSSREIWGQEAADEAGLGRTRTPGVHQPVSKLDQERGYPSAQPEGIRSVYGQTLAHRTILWA
jgi:hypothetical protein